MFNIKGNQYLFVADIEFRLKLVFIVWIGTHAIYNKIKVKEINYVKNIIPIMGIPIVCLL